MYISTFWLIVIGVIALICIYAYWNHEQQRKTLENQFSLFMHNMVKFASMHSYRYTVKKPIARKNTLYTLSFYFIDSINSQITPNTINDVIDTLELLLPDFKVDHKKYNKVSGKISLSDSGLEELRNDFAIYLDKAIIKELKLAEQRLADKLIEDGEEKDHAEAISSVAMSMTEDDFSKFADDVNEMMDNIIIEAIEKSKKQKIIKTKKSTPHKKKRA